ncbi:MAG TPA: TIM barrel protein [Lacunisphaera sp.]|nr:TIM barrel protein [Lacunisphaera sp.]
MAVLRCFGSAALVALAVVGLRAGPAGTEPMKPPATRPALFAPSNLLAWCIVPFDKNQRTPAERVAMLRRLGFTQYAWDWRANHLKDLPDEIRLARENGIRLRAVWLWIEGGGADEVGHLGAGNREVMDTISQAGLAVEYWVGFHPDFFAGLDEPARVSRAAAMMTYLRDQAAVAHSTVAFYNHGDWIGEPDNQIKVIKAMKGPAVGIVFNFHHAHDMLDRFPALLEHMLPYLTAININGMNAGGPKILPIGQGNQEREMLRLVKASGYAGPIGILGHVDDADVEVILKRNLDGLRQLAAGLEP